MQKLLLNTAAILALAAPLAANAASQKASTGMTFASAPLFVGQIDNHTRWVPMIQSMQPNADGYYEMFYQKKYYAQESFADHKAIKLRAECNATRSDACVINQPDWQEVLQTFTYVQK